MGRARPPVDHLVQVLAHELGPRQVTVNSVLPGAVDTDALRDSMDSEARAGEIAVTPLGRIGKPADIADIVAFLASDEGRWVTGQRIGAGGGMFSASAPATCRTSPGPTVAGRRPGRRAGRARAGCAS